MATKKWGKNIKFKEGKQLDGKWHIHSMVLLIYVFLDDETFRQEKVSYMINNKGIGETQREEVKEYIQVEKREIGLGTQ